VLTTAVPHCAPADHSLPIYHPCHKGYRVKPISIAPCAAAALAMAGAASSQAAEPGLQTDKLIAHSDVVRLHSWVSEAVAPGRPPVTLHYGFLSARRERGQGP